MLAAPPDLRPPRGLPARLLGCLVCSAGVPGAFGPGRPRDRHTRAALGVVDLETRPCPPDPPAPFTPAGLRRPPIGRYLVCSAGVPGAFGPGRLISDRRGACPPARRPRRELRSARRLEARPGPAGPAAASNRAVLGVHVLGLALPPPVGTAAGPSGALHTGGVAAASHRAELSAAGWSAQALPQSRCAARARRLARTEESSQSALRHASATHTTPIAIQRNVGTVS